MRKRVAHMCLAWSSSVLCISRMTKLRTRAVSLFRIRVLHHIRLSLTEEMATVVACALVQSRVDCANSLYIGMSFVNFVKLGAEFT